jgi:hypothetical protein
MSKKIIGDVNLSNWHLEQLPEILKDVSIDGHFYCVGNRLISLINAPSSVKGDFHCAYNKLTSLEGAPKTVNGHFFCYQNSVKFTEKQVRSVSDVKGMVGV